MNRPSVCPSKIHGCCASLLCEVCAHVEPLTIAVPKGFDRYGIEESGPLSDIENIMGRLTEHDDKLHEMNPDPWNNPKRPKNPWNVHVKRECRICFGRLAIWEEVACGKWDYWLCYDCWQVKEEDVQ